MFFFSITELSSCDKKLLHAKLSVARNALHLLWSDLSLRVHVHSEYLEFSKKEEEGSGQQIMYQEHKLTATSTIN